MVNFAAAIAAKQQNVTPKAMLKGLATQDYPGICADYKADAIQVLSHAVDITKFDSSGQVSIGST